MIRLYHTSHVQIPQPDVHYGRKNADFGQGFYLSGDLDFSRRWAQSRKGQSTYVNVYDLDLDGLRVQRFDRDGAWYDYIFRNRAGYADALAEYDVIIGPIANDTLYNTWGVLTSGLLTRDQSLALFTLGPRYTQTVLKTERATAQLHWLSALTLTEEDIAAFRAAVQQEEAVYQEQLAAALEGMLR